MIRTVPYKLERLDPALDSILSKDSPLEILGEHFGLTESPVWIQEAEGGYLLFSDCTANVIYKWQPNAPLSVFLERSGEGRTRTLLADKYDGKRFSGPNDGVAKSGGAISVTDSINRLRGGGDSPQRELPSNGFYLVKDGKVTLSGGDRDHPGDFPNGIALSPDEKAL